MTQNKPIKVGKGVEKRKDAGALPTKVVMRRLPPSLTPESLIEQISPLPEHDFFYFVKADMSLGVNAFTRAYINFMNPAEIFNFRDKFDGYVFIDSKGNEYPAIVEFAPFQKVPKRKTKKPDSKKGTLEQDADYLKFKEMLESPGNDDPKTIDEYLEELEAKEREMKSNHGCVKTSTPLIEYLKKRKEEKRANILKIQEERKRREQEKRRLREEERRRRRERDKERDRGKDKEKDKASSSDSSVKLLKNPDRDEKQDKPSSARGESKSVRDDDAKRKEREKLRFSKENREKMKNEKSIANQDRPKSGRGFGKEVGEGRRDRQESDRRPDSGRRQEKSGREEKKYGRDRNWESERDRQKEKRNIERGSSTKKDVEKKSSAKGEEISSKDKEPEPSKSSSTTKETEDNVPERKISAASREGEEVVDSTDDAESSKNSSSRRGSRDTDKQLGGVDIDSSDTKSEISVDSAGEDGKLKSRKLEKSRSKDDLDDKKKKRRDRPEREIYDPRKAAERRRAAGEPRQKDEKEKPRKYSSDERQGEKTSRGESQASPRDSEERVDSRPSSGEGSRRRDKDKREKETRPSPEASESRASELEEGSNANNNATTSESVEKEKEEEEDVGSSVDPVNVGENTGGGTEEPEKQKAPGTETSVSEENVVEDELSVD